MYSWRGSRKHTQTHSLSFSTQMPLKLCERTFKSPYLCCCSSRPLTAVWNPALEKPPAALLAAPELHPNTVPPTAGRGTARGDASRSVAAAECSASTSLCWPKSPHRSWCCCVGGCVGLCSLVGLVRWIVQTSIHRCWHNKRAHWAIGGKFHFLIHYCLFLFWFICCTLGAMCLMCSARVWDCGCV